MENEFLLLACLMVTFAFFQLYINGQVYLEGFKSFLYICQALWLLLLHLMHLR